LSVSRSSNPGSAPFLSGTTLLVVVLVVVVVAAIGVAVLVVVMKPRLAGLEKSEEKDAEQRPKDAWSSSQQSPKPTAKDSTHK
jgi:NADH:ubiquinone oxidoreductase subunit 6 (subunit J)